MSSKFFFVIGIIAMLIIVCVILRGIAPQVFELKNKKMPPFIMLFTGNTYNALEPSGCCRKQRGGLLRRATMIREWRKKGIPVLVLDNGNVVDYYMTNQTRELERKKLAIMHKALKLMGYDAVNIGESDLFFADELKGLAKNDIPLLSRNVTLKGAAITPSMLWKKEGGCVGIAGITTPPRNYKGKGDYTCLSPELSLARISRELRNKASFVILLSQLSIEENRTIAHRNPWINVIIGNKDTTMMKEGETLILPTGLRGEYLGKAAVCYDKKLKKYDVTVEMILLKEGIEDEIDMRKLLDGLYREHLGIHIESGQPPQKTVTAQECRTCHPAAYTQWSSTKHAEAFNDLVNKGRGQHPGCVECHATIEKSAAPLFERKIYREQCGIQCTVCHRKDRKHYRSGRLLVEKDCTPCHDKEHNRDFEFATYRKKIEMREEHRELQKR